MTRQIGFTLIELAIVLVVVGLIVGGVLMGQELIKQSQQNKLFAELQGYETATTLFKSKYNALPGDFRNAQAFFGTNALSCPNGASTIGTCNGDGNRVFSGNEYWRFWQQLAQDELIAGSYTGLTDAVWTGTVCGSTPGLNVPESKINPKTGFELNQGNIYNVYSLAFKVAQCKLVNNLNKGIFTPFDAQLFDTKFDDGDPAKGKIVWSGEFGVGGCTNRGDNIGTQTSATWLNVTTEARELCYPFYLIEQ